MSEGLNDDVVEEFHIFLRKAKAANAVPVWWADDAEEEAAESASWDDEGRHVGRIKSDMFIGRRVPKDHAAKQYGGDQKQWNKIKKLTVAIDAANEPVGSDEEFW